MSSVLEINSQPIQRLINSYNAASKLKRRFYPTELVRAIEHYQSHVEDKNALAIFKAIAAKIGRFRQELFLEFEIFLRSDLYQTYEVLAHSDFLNGAWGSGNFDWLLSFKNPHIPAQIVKILSETMLFTDRTESLYKTYIKRNKYLADTLSILMILRKNRLLNLFSGEYNVTVLSNRVNIPILAAILTRLDLAGFSAIDNDNYKLLVNHNNLYELKIALNNLIVRARARGRRAYDLLEDVHRIHYFEILVTHKNPIAAAAALELLDSNILLQPFYRDILKHHPYPEDLARTIIKLENAWQLTVSKDLIIEISRLPIPIDSILLRLQCAYILNDENLKQLLCYKSMLLSSTSSLNYWDAIPVKGLTQKRFNDIIRHCSQACSNRDGRHAFQEYIEDTFKNADKKFREQRFTFYAQEQKNRKVYKQLPNEEPLGGPDVVVYTY